MKKKLFLILCIALSLLMLTACGRKQKTPEKIPVETSTPVPTAIPTPVPTATPMPTPEPTKAPVSTPAPVQIPLPKISKEPADETVTANGSCTFVAQCDNAALAEWHFISPDSSLDVSYSAVQNQYLRRSQSNLLHRPHRTTALSGVGWMKLPGSGSTSHIRQKGV